MKLIIKKHNLKEVTVEGREARQELRSILVSITKNMLIPEPPFTGIVRRQVLDALRSGRPVWDEPSEHGSPTGTSTIVTMPVKIVGVIRADGTWDGEGPDPRLSGGAGEDKGSAP